MAHTSSTCTPLKPFRCRQYRKDSTEPAPKWLYGPGLRWEAIDGNWAVNIRPGQYVWYTPSGFAERFRMEQP
jgi:hypothetical protein